MNANIVSIEMEIGSNRLKRVSINGAKVAANSINVDKQMGKGALVTVFFWADINWITPEEPLLPAAE